MGPTTSPEPRSTPRPSPRHPGRLSQVADPTVPGSAVISPAPRVGWMLRMARLTHTSRPTLDQLAGRLDTSQARLSRVENGLVWDSSVVGDYERALSLTAGSLRGPAGILARTFPSTTPADTAPPPAFGVRETSQLTERLLDETVDADPGTWLTWATALSQRGATGLPERLALRLFARLTADLEDSTGAAFAARYEALALLRCSDYGYLAGQVLVDHIRSPGSRSVNDQFSAFSERPSRSATRWLTRQLGADDDRTVIGASFALQNVLSIDPHSPTVVEEIPEWVDVHAHAPSGTRRHDAVADLLRATPDRAWAQQSVARPTDPSPLVRLGAREAGRLHRECEVRALEFSDSWELHPQPMLARLVFDAAFTDNEAVSCTAFHLLSAVPAVRDHAVTVTAAIAGTVRDPRVRHRALVRLAGARLLPQASGTGGGARGR